MDMSGFILIHKLPLLHVGKNTTLRRRLRNRSQASKHERRGYHMLLAIRKFLTYQRILVRIEGIVAGGSYANENRTNYKSNRVAPI